MTNNEKVQKMLESVARLVKDSARALDRSNLSSAEWIYLKAQREAYINTMAIVERIYNEKGVE